MSGTWHCLGNAEAIPVGGIYAATLGDWAVLVARTEAGLSAVIDCCSHQATRLSAGRVRRGAIMCPLHGARFDLATGKNLGGAYRDLRTFPVRDSEGGIEVCVPDTQPRTGEVPVEG
ncbi:MAG: Rieske (2Fe-2S) protein [Tsuneonella sp.]